MIRGSIAYSNIMILILSLLCPPTVYNICVSERLCVYICVLIIQNCTKESKSTELRRGGRTSMSIGLKLWKNERNVEISSQRLLQKAMTREKKRKIRR